MVFHFHNTLLNFLNISSLFSGGIIIFSTGSCFTILLSFDLATVYEILFSINSTALWTTFLEASIPVPNNCFLYFLVNYKNPYRLTYSLVLGFIEYRCISTY